MWEVASPTRQIDSGHHDRPMADVRPRNAEHLDSVATTIKRNRGDEIHSWEGDGENWYKVKSGAAKFYIVLPGGRRQILDLLLPSDFLGSSPYSSHYCTLEAVVNSTVVTCYPRKSVEALARTNPEVGLQVQAMARGAVSRMQELTLILGRITAREKVGAFLLKMAERTSTLQSDQLVLPMSRYDIAEYLALSVETVSRSLTDLRHGGLISLAGPRRVEIMDRQRLEDGRHAGAASRI